MVFKQLGTDADKFTKRMGLFSKSFSDIRKDLSNGLGLRRGLFTVITEKDVKFLNDFNKAINSGTKYSEAFNAHMSKSPIAVKRQANELIKLHTQQKQLNQQYNAGKITQQEYNTAMTANKAKIQALTTQTQTLTLAQRAAAFASKALGVALNVALNVGLMFAINAIITGITKLVNRQKELKESTDELISSFKSVKDEANDLSKNSDELASEYSKLSKGVDGLGNNVELTSEEYERYKEVTNQIAEDIPSLIKGYDDEGNAILDLKGNVDELKQAYIDARREKYNLMLLEHGDTIDDTVKNYKELKDVSVWSALVDFGAPTAGGRVSVKAAIKDLETVLSSSYEDVHRMVSDVDFNNLTASGELQSREAKFGYWKNLGLTTETTKEEFEELRNTLKTELQKLKAEVQTGLTGIKDVANIYLFSNEDYYKLDEDMQNIASVIVNGMTDEIAESFESSADVGAYVIDIVDKLKEATPEVKSAYTNLFELSLDEMSISEAKNQVDKYIQEIADYLGIDAYQLKIQLGFSIVDENQDELQHIMSKAAAKYSKGRRTYSSSFLASAEEHGVNTKEELAILNECVEATTNATNTWALYEQRIAETAEANEDNIRSLEELKEAYDGLSDSASNYSKNQKTLTSALEEQEKHGQLSASTIQELVDAGYAQALVTDKETGAVTLDREAYEKLNEQKKLKIKLDLQNEQSDLESKLEDERKAVSELKQEYESLANADMESNAGRLSEITLELAKRGENIADISDLISQLKGDIASLDAPEFDTGSGNSSKPTQVINYEKWVAQQEHEIAMGRLKEDEAYYSEKLRRAEEAYKGLADYEQDLWKVQEEVYNGRKKLAEETFDNKHDLFEQRVNELEEYADKVSETAVTSDGTKLSTQEKYREIASVYEKIRTEIQKEIDRIKQIGIEGHEDLLKELEEQSKKYADEINNNFKDAVEAEKTLLEKAKKAKLSEYDEQIDKVKSQQEAAQKAADAEIEAIQTKIDNLQKVNDEKQHEYDIEKAKQDLEKAGQRTRRVYGSDGSIEYRADTDAINEAQKNLDDLLLEKQIEGLENQQTVLEQMRDKESASYDTMIADIEEHKKNTEKRFDELIDEINEYSNPTNDTLNSDVWEAIAKANGATYKDGKYITQNGSVFDIKGMYNVLEKDKEEKTNPNADNSKVNTNKPLQVSGNVALIEKILTNMNANQDVIKRIVDNFNNNRLDPSLYNIMFSFTQQPTQDALKQFEGQYRIDPNSYEVANRNTTVSPVFNGDIVVNNPVGNSNDLAKELMMNLPNAMQQKLYSNLKKY